MREQNRNMRKTEACPVWGVPRFFWFESTRVPYWKRTYNKKLNAIVPIGRDEAVVGQLWIREPRI